MRPKPRVAVLVVSNFLSVVGKSRGYAEDLSDRFERHGRAVIRTSSRPERARRMLDMVQTTWRARASYDIAIVDVFSGPSFAWAEAVTLELRLLRKPYVLVLHGGSLPEFAQRWPRRVRRLLRGARRVIAPSAYLAGALSAYCDRIEIVPNATEVARFTYRRRVRAEPRMIWVRAMHAIYNPVLAVEVLAAIRARHAAATLTMVGTDKDGSLARVEQRADELGVRNAVRCVGGVTSREIPALLAGADIFLNTTNVDNTPLSVLEAMATGLCIVSTSVGGIPYLLRNGETALLVPPNDAPAMAAAVERIHADDGLAAALSANARAAAEQRDWPVVLASWDRVLAEAA